MKTYTMTEAETQGWDSDDARERDTMRKEVRAKAWGLVADMTGTAVEIYSTDGVLMDVVVSQ